MEKKKAPKEEKDETSMKLYGIYRRKCEQNGVPPVKVFKDKLEAVLQQGKIEIVQMWEEIGPVCVRAMMDTFSEIGYKHLKKLKLWKIRAEDQGLRSICNYIEKAQTIEYLDLLDNNITPLGCEFLGKTLSGACPIIKLKLDHNCIGTEGLKNLTIGLCKNNIVEKLSLKYCNIDEGGARYIQQILANLKSKLKSLKLQGNPLKNEGAFQLLRAVDFNETLEKLNLADIQINLLSEIDQSPEELRLTEKMVEVLDKNKNIYKYDLRFNQLCDEAALKMVMKVQSNTSIVKFELSQTVAQQIRELLAQTIKKRKIPKKGKKKKAASKKKK